VNHAERLRQLADRMGLDGYAEELREIAGEMEAQPPAQVWQPIDTAPKDGTSFLGYWLGGDHDCSMHAVKFFRGGWWQTNEDYKCREPAYWMPLPPPPATLKGQQ
jgi:hypothetical protein